MENNAALYIGADPFTFNDLGLVKQAISMFGFVNIFLDRKNRDAEHKEYVLSYADRQDIIRHDLKASGISQYALTPIDSTLQEAIQNERVKTLLLNFDYQQTIGFRMAKVIGEVSPQVNIALISAPTFIERHFMKTLLESDATMSIYKKYCSDYSFYKFKLKSMKKIGLTGNDEAALDIAQKAFESHGFKVCNIEKFLETLPKDVLENEKKMYNEVMGFIGHEMVGHFGEKAIVRGKKLYEYAMEKMFKKIICVKCVDFSKDGEEMSCMEKASYADYVIDGNASAQVIASQVSELINTKLKWL